MAMSPVQRFFTWIFPKSWAASMEADSRRWKLQCSKCRHERSFWDIGGIRWKAKGNQRTYMKCPACGDRNWHRAYFADAE